MYKAGDVRNRIKKHCFRALILKLVNPLESLEDGIANLICMGFVAHP